jgi:diguanylate cyclase (GGDEF)-like protein/PAS domain S-box-containing protein
MQNTLLDIVILGLLVLLFGSIYRTRATPRLRWWILGWLFILVHFLLLLPRDSNSLRGLLIDAAGASALMLGAVCFILGASVTRPSRWPRWWASFILAGPALLYIFLTNLGYSHPWPLIALAVGCEVAAIATILNFWRGSRNILLSVISMAVIAVLWIAYDALHGEADVGIYALLTQFYLTNALVYAKDFRRVSFGVVTTVGGLVAWAMVFPCALALAYLLPHQWFSPEIWNLPKYFVEFGMILTLMEDEIIAASREREEYRVLFDGNPHPMWIFDSESLGFLKVNDAAVKHYGYSREQFLGMSLRDIRRSDLTARLERRPATADEMILSSGAWTHMCGDGRLIQAELASHAITFEGRPARFTLVKDVTERQRLHEQLLHQAHHDILTGLPNRLLLKARMEQTLTEAARHDSRAAVICIDLDRFKQINDTYGHPVGDACLRQVGERLTRRLRATDTVARSGGEEFTVVIGELTAVAGAERVVAELVECFQVPYETDGYSLDLAASFGVAVYPDHGTEAQALWRLADAAMYKAKHSGGNQYVIVSTELSNLTAEANEIESCIRRALKGGGFELHYQPQFTMEGQLCGLEGLLRLNHPHWGQILPDRFIPIAEESGLIIPLGAWVLEEVCRQSAEWRDRGLPLVPTSFNVSLLQFIRSDFSALVQGTIARYGIEPSLLGVEMTETTVMHNVEDTTRQMLELSQLGVRFSVDDFGTGYSSMRHLHQLPIDTLKIDRSFIEQIAEPNGTFSIVQAILSLAHGLQMRVLAEGVETAEQLAQLRELRCDMVQGYLWGRPQPASAIPAVLISCASMKEAFHAQAGG